MGGGIKPVQSTSTRWIDHRICTMQNLVDKYGLCQHLHHTIPLTKKTKDRAIFQGTFDKLIDVKVLLGSCFFVDPHSTAKQFSLTTQKADIDIISIVNNVESTKNSHEKLLRKFKSDADRALSLPTSKSEIKETESDEYGNHFTKGKIWNTIAERFSSWRIMEQRSLNLFSPAIPKVTVIFIQKLLLTILLVMVTQYFLMPTAF